MYERTGKIPAERRVNFLDQLRSARVINMDAPASSVINATGELPGGAASLTLVYGLV
jgi:hypothetical protein